MQFFSAVISAARRTMGPISATASILIPALVEPMLTLLHTMSVAASASGIESISSRSPAEKPFCTKAENPPTKLTPTFFAAASSVRANSTGSGFLQGASSMAIGVTEMRLLTMGTPYAALTSSAVFTRSLARVVILL
ncbi:hypothetical protein SDC9_159116 [bioreactor metagenome]|uniref:Uncharacterized protein n=1 Tax=bioreactor metagenome TaxID=1076179 RepID=A0A645FBS1_9ZZZZ